jgi:hypothetical protein
MKWLLILVLLPALVSGQENIVPNPDFEEISDCPWDISQIDLAYPWTNSGNSNAPDSPDLFNNCALNPYSGVPINSMGFQNAYSGLAYSGIFTIGNFIVNPEVREYLQVELTESIYAGVRYEVVFNVSLGDEYGHAIGTIGAYFSETRVARETLFYLDVVPQIQSTEGIILDSKDGWMTVRDTFNSRYGGEKFMLIGNFFPDSLSGLTYIDEGSSTYNRNRSYYYIDDVSVVALDSIPSGVGEIEKFELKVYPNPNDGLMTVAYQLAEGESGKLSIYTTIGILIYEHALSASDNLTEIKLNNIPSGIYLLNIEVNGERKLTERINVIR